MESIKVELKFFVSGCPAPQGSKRYIGNGVMIESSKNVKPWRIDIAWTARQYMNGNLVTGPLHIDLEFVMPRPKSAPKRITPPATKRPDLDKLCRSVLDALKNVIYQDDSQVIELTSTKRLAELGELSGVYIAISEQSLLKQL